MDNSTYIKILIDHLVVVTVVVRDLFYNQPVRRKYMQSRCQSWTILFSSCGLYEIVFSCLKQYSAMK